MDLSFLVAKTPHHSKIKEKHSDIFNDQLIDKKIDITYFSLLTANREAKIKSNCGSTQSHYQLPVSQAPTIFLLKCLLHSGAMTMGVG